MKRLFLQLAVISLFLFATASTSFSHCEIPCGIYDDEVRITLIGEHITTIEKSMGKIEEIRMAEKQDHNQLVRWVMNKEEHANQLQHIVTQYFMTQRLKVGTENYAEQLSILHQMLIAAMKSKQTTDTKYTTELRELLSRFDTLYFKPH